MNMKRSGWMALTVPVALGCSTVTLADGQMADMEARMAQLEQRIVELQANQSAEWMNEQRRDEVAEIVRDVIADADTRTSLLQSGAVAGHDGNFFLGSADGNFRLALKGQQQFRFVFNSQDDGASDSTRWGFENTRTRLIFSGHVVDPSWIYQVSGLFSSSGGGFTLEDAWIGKAMDNGWVFLAGQLQVPATREEAVDDPYHLAIERSLVDQEFSAGYTQGVALAYMGDQLHATFAVTDGHQATGGYNRAWNNRDTEISLTARAEYLVSGSWGQFTDMTSPRGSENGFMLGGAVHYQNGEYGTMADEIEALQWTVDGSWEFDGANIFAAVIGRHLSGAADRDDYGIVVQGGYYLNDDWEIYGRFEYGDDDVDDAEELMILTIGANRYYAGNNVRWSTDVGFAFDEVSSTWGSGYLGSGGTGAGWRTDATDDDGQIVIRSQLQLLF